MGLINRLFSRVKSAVGNLESGREKTLASLRRKGKKELLPRNLRLESLEDRQLLSVTTGSEIYGPLAVSASLTTNVVRAAETTVTTSSVAVPSINAEVGERPADAIHGSDGNYHLGDISNSSTDYDRVRNGLPTAQQQGSGIKRQGVTYQEYYWIQTAAEMLWAANWAQNAGFTSIDDVQDHIIENFDRARNGYTTDVLEWFITGDYTTVDDRYYDGSMTGTQKTNANGGGFFQEVNYDAVASYATAGLSDVFDHNSEYATGVCGQADTLDQIFLALDSNTAVSVETSWIVTDLNAVTDLGSRIITGSGDANGWGWDRSGSLTDSNSLVVSGLGYNTKHRLITAISFASNDEAIGIEAGVYYLVEWDPTAQCYRFAIEPNWLKDDATAITARRAADPRFDSWWGNGHDNTNGTYRYLSGRTGAAAAYHVAYTSAGGVERTLVKDTDNRGFQTMAIVGLNFLQNYFEKISPVSLTDGHGTTDAAVLHLESNPGSQNVIYINPEYFNADFDGSNLSFQEKAWLVEVWQRVAEDFAPFNVNVTTDESVYNAASGVKNAPNYATILNTYRESRTDSFTAPSSFYATIFGISVAYDTTFEKFIAEGISYAAGRAAGLTESTYVHSENPGGVDNYPGRFDWGPIMSYTASVAKRMTQWSQDGYYGADGYQDQLAVLAARFGLREDDYASSFEEAKTNTKSALQMVEYSGNYGSTQMTCQAQGVVGLGEWNADTRSYGLDADWFSFSSYGGKYVIDVSGTGADARWRVADGFDGALNYFDWWMTNLNVQLDVFAEDGSWIQSVSSVGTSFAHLAITLDAKTDEETGEIIPTTYYFRVAGTGEGNATAGGYSAYGSLGQYTLSVTENYEDFIKYDDETGRSYIVVTTLEDTIALDNEVSLREALYMIGRRLEEFQGGAERYVGSEIRFDYSLLWNDELNREYTVEELANGAATIHLNQELGSLMLNYQLKSGTVTSQVGGEGSISTVINAQKYWKEDATAPYGGSFLERAGANITVDARAVDGTSVIRTVCVDNIETELNGLIITGGNARAEAVTEVNNSVDHYGGGVFNHYGWLTINNSRVSGNRSLKGGGGIYNTGGWGPLNYPMATGNEYKFNDSYGYLYLINTEISGNIATFSQDENTGSFGGGIVNDLCGQIDMINCTVAGNVAAWSGGGIENMGRIFVYNSIVARNFASRGTDIYAEKDAYNYDGYTNLYYSLVGDRTYANDSDNGDTTRVPWNYGEKYGKAISLVRGCVSGTSSVDPATGKRINISVVDPRYTVFSDGWVVMNLQFNDQVDDNGLKINGGYQLFETVDVTQTFEKWYVDLWKTWNLSVMSGSSAIDAGNNADYADKIYNTQYGSWSKAWDSKTPEGWLDAVDDAMSQRSLRDYRTDVTVGGQDAKYLAYALAQNYSTLYNQQRIVESATYLQPAWVDSARTEILARLLTSTERGTATNAPTDILKALIEGYCGSEGVGTTPGTTGIMSYQTYTETTKTTYYEYFKAEAKKATDYTKTDEAAIAARATARKNIEDGLDKILYQMFVNHYGATVLADPDIEAAIHTRAAAYANGECRKIADQLKAADVAVWKDLDIKDRILGYDVNTGTFETNFANAWWQNDRLPELAITEDVVSKWSTKVTPTLDTTAYNTKVYGGFVIGIQRVSKWTGTEMSQLEAMAAYNAAASSEQYYTDMFNSWVANDTTNNDKDFTTELFYVMQTEERSYFAQYAAAVYGEGLATQLVASYNKIERMSLDDFKEWCEDERIYEGQSVAEYANTYLASVKLARISTQKLFECSLIAENIYGSREATVFPDTTLYDPLVPETTPFAFNDLIRNDRIVNDRIDMGAYEYQLDANPDFTGFTPLTVNTDHVESDWSYPVVVGKSTTDREGIGLVVDESTYDDFLLKDRSANTIISSETVLLDFAYINQGSATAVGTTLTVNFDLAVAENIADLKSGYTDGEYNPEKYDPSGYTNVLYNETLFQFKVAGPYAATGASLSLTAGAWAGLALEGGSITIPGAGSDRASARLFGDLDGDNNVDDGEEVFGTVYFYSNGLITIENLTFDAMTRTTDKLGIYQFAMYLDSENVYTNELRKDNNFYASIIRVIEDPGIVVTTTDDVVDPYDGKISLREALVYANYEKREEQILTEGTKVSVVVDGVPMEYEVRNNKFYQVVSGDFYFTDSSTKPATYPLADGTAFADGDTITIVADSIALYRVYDNVGKLLRTEPVLLSANTQMTYRTGSDGNYFVDSAGGEYELWYNTKISKGAVTYRYSTQNLVSANFAAKTVLSSVYDSWNAIWTGSKLQTVEKGYFRVAADNVASKLIDNDEVQVLVDDTTSGLYRVNHGNLKAKPENGMYDLTYTNGYFTDADGDVYVMDVGTGFVFVPDGTSYVYAVETKTDVVETDREYLLYDKADETKIAYHWDSVNDQWVDDDENVKTLEVDGDYTLVDVQTNEETRVEVKSGVTVNVIKVWGSDVYFDATVFLYNDESLVITLDSANGPLVVDKSVTIHAESRRDKDTDEIVHEGESKAISVSGGGLVQVFNITTAGSDVQFNNLTISDGFADGQNGSLVSGGGIALAEGATLSLVDCLISDNVASLKGGGIYALGELSMINTKVLSNSVNATVSEFQTKKYFYGGGVYLENADSYELTGCEISGNGINITEEYGAVNTEVYMCGGGFYTNGTLVVTDTPFKNNKIVVNGMNSTSFFGFGGAIYATNVTVEAPQLGVLPEDKTVFEGNEANEGFGGAIYAVDSVTVEDIEFKTNIAKTGGAIYAADQLIFIGGNLNGNTAVDNAGAIYVGGDALLTSSTVSGNSTKTGDGGAFYFSGKADVLSTVLSGNMAGTDTGATGNGGAVYSLVPVVFDGVVALTGNSASGDGGAIYTTEGTISQRELSTLQLVDNYAAGNGGAVYAGDGMNLSSSVTLTGNTSGLAGGGVYAVGKVVVENSSIYGHVAGTNGGAIAANDIVVVNSEIFGNVAENGGGLYAVKSLKLVNATVTQNTAKSQGGGLFVADPVATSAIYNSIIAINHAGADNVNTDRANDVQISGTYDIAHSLIGIGDSLTDATGTSVYLHQGTVSLPLDPEFVKEFHWDIVTGTWINATGLLRNLQLSPASVGINNGDNALAVYENGTSIEYDILGNPRIYTDPVEPVNVVDLGAYELLQQALCDLAFYREGTVDGGTARLGDNGAWGAPVVLSIDSTVGRNTDPLVAIADGTFIATTDVVSVGVSFFNSDLATGSCAREFPVTITCYRVNSRGEMIKYGDEKQYTVGKEVYELKQSASDYFVVDWGTLVSGTYYFEVELNSADQQGDYAFKEVKRDNNKYMTTSITVKHDDEIIVNTAEDYSLEGDWDSDDKVSLREALELAELWSIEDDELNTDLRKIRFDSSVMWKDNPILLNKDNGPLSVTCSVDLVGADASGNALNITIDGQNEVRIFQIVNFHDDENVTPESGLIATIENLTLINGNATTMSTSDDADDSVKAAGGAIASAALGTADRYGLTLKNVTMTGNIASSGGAVKNVGKMWIENCTINGNKTQFDQSQMGYTGDFGGGIYNGGELYIIQSTISGNTAGKYGGGIVSYGNSDWGTETDNITYGKLDIYNTVISGNEAAYGGGICLSPTASNTPVTMSNVTIVGNVAATQGGGLWYSNKVDLSVMNSIIYGNVCKANFNYDNIYPKSSTPVTALGNSIYSSTPAIEFVNFTTGTQFDRTKWNTWDLRIAASGDVNVVNRGDNASVVGTVDRDGNARTNGANVDLGAYEWYSQYLKIDSTTITVPLGATSVPAGTMVGILSTQLVDSTGVTYATTSADFRIDNGKLVTAREILVAKSPVSVTVTATKANGSVYDQQTWEITLVNAPLSTPSVASTHQVDGDEVFLTWSGVEGATGFRVRYKLFDAAEWTYATEVCSGTSGVVRGGFTVGGTYVFQVQAIGGQFSSDSEWSDAQRTLLRVAAVSASAMVDSGPDLGGWSARQCVTIEYRTPSFETNLSELLEGQMVKLSAKVERSRSLSVVGWEVHWGDGASSVITGRFDSITAAHYYRSEGTYCISLNVLDSQGAGNDILYYVGSHTFGQPNAVVQEAAVAAVAVEEEIIEAVPQALVTGAVIPEINVVAANANKVSLEANVADTKAKSTGSVAVNPVLATGSQFARRNWAINQLVQNLHSVKTDRFFASLPESGELDTDLDYGFETSLEPAQTQSVYDEVLDEMNI